MSTYSLSNLRQRFDSKWIPEPNTGCWLWMGARTGSGYGAFVDRNRRTLPAHRVGWEFYRGPIPEGMFIDHVCRMKMCVNPEHLRIVTPRQNSTENSAGPQFENARLTCCRVCGSALTSMVHSRKTGKMFRRCYPCHLRAENERGKRIRRDRRELRARQGLL